MISDIIALLLKTKMLFYFYWVRVHIWVHESKLAGILVTNVAERFSSAFTFFKKILFKIQIKQNTLSKMEMLHSNITDIDHYKHALHRIVLKNFQVNRKILISYLTISDLCSHNFSKFVIKNCFSAAYSLPHNIM